jgi:hypothetical protein
MLALIAPAGLPFQAEEARRVPDVQDGRPALQVSNLPGCDPENRSELAEDAVHNEESHVLWSTPSTAEKRDPSAIERSWNQSAETLEEQIDELLNDGKFAFFHVGGPVNASSRSFSPSAVH